jgi:hypothetical protein
MLLWGMLYAVRRGTIVPALRPLKEVLNGNGPICRDVACDNYSRGRR